MEMSLTVSKQKGFTLVEIVAVLILLGILAVISVPKYITLTVETKNKAINAAIAELNSRESMEWSKAMLNGAVDDATIKAAVTGSSLGDKYSMVDSANGAILTFEDETVALTRTAGDAVKPGAWKRTATE